MLLSELIRDIRKSVIGIQTELKFGSGFFVNEEGYAVTCRHVVETINGRGTVHTGIAYVLKPFTVRYIPLKFRVKRTEPMCDLAIIKIDDEQPFEPLRLDDNFGDRIAGEDVALFGFPFLPYLKHPSLTRGIISAVYTNPESGVDMIQTDMWIYDASSGSPCFLTEDGTVIGYATSYFDPFRERLKKKGIEVEIKFGGEPFRMLTNISFVVPAKYSIKLLQEVIS